MKPHTVFLAVALILPVPTSAATITTSATTSITPGTILAGETATISITETIIMPPGVSVAGGSGHLEISASPGRPTLLEGDGWSFISRDFTFTFSNPGLYNIGWHHEGYIGCWPSSACSLTWIMFDGGAQLTVLDPAVVPGPIIGGGLPGLALAIGGFLAWRRSRH